MYPPQKVADISLNFTVSYPPDVCGSKQWSAPCKT